MARNSLLRIRQIVMDFCEVTKRAGDDAGEPDLRAEVEPTIDVFRRRAERRGVLFEVDLAPWLPASRCTPNELNQIVFHLLANSIDACADGDTIKLRAFPIRGSLEVHVTDTGCGIAPELLDKIFEPFFTTKPPGLGDGIGLSLSRLIAEENGGEIRVESAPGGPTRFTVRLPMAPGASVESPDS
jgi:signal transduction histidine kinase